MTFSQHSSEELKPNSEQCISLEDRANLRRLVRKKRRELSTQDRIAASFALLNQLRTQIWYLRAKRVAAYLASDGEMSLAPVICDGIDRRRKVFLPRVDRSKPHMQLVQWRSEDSLIDNRFGILEPRQSKACWPDSLSIILTPLVSFDSKGNRIGMGAGYYDRYFAHAKRPLTIGVAYDFQQVESLVAQSWDQQLDGVVTDKKVIKISARLRALSS